MATTSALFTRPAFTPAVSIVTGGASGIGRALTRRLVERDGRVIVADRDEAAATALAESLGGRTVAVGIDVTEPGAVPALVQRTVQREGRLDLMANNAGALLYGPVEEVEERHWDQALALNLRAVIDGLQAAYAVMAPRRAGVILNTGSLAGLMVSPRQLPYTTTKHAVVAYSRALAIEARARRVRVHVLCPGFVDTKLLDEPLDPGEHTGSFRRYAHSLQPRLLTADEVAGAALRGIERGRTIIPVGAFTRAIWAVERLSPALMDAGSRFATRRENEKTGLR